MLGLMTTVLAQADSSGPSAGGIAAILVAMIVGLVIGLVITAALGALMFWKVFEKAGQPGWHSVVPIFNYYVLLTKVAFKPGWWALAIIGMFIPFVNFVAWIALIAISILASISVAKNFGKDTGYVVGLVLLPIVFYPILGFGDAKFNPVAGPSGGAPPVAG